MKKHCASRMCRHVQAIPVAGPRGEEGWTWNSHQLFQELLGTSFWYEGETMVVQ